MVERYHQPNGHEFEQTWERAKEREAWSAAAQGVAKESDMTQQLSNKKNKKKIAIIIVRLSLHHNIVYEVDVSYDNN